MQATSHHALRTAGTGRGRAMWRGGKVLAMLVVLLIASAAQADSVKISGFWIDNVTVDAVVEGQIIFRPSGGRSVEQPLGKLEGLKLDRLPQLAEAEQALADNQPATAIEELREAVDEARRPWARHFARQRLVSVLDASGDPLAAVQAYVALVREPEVDPALLTAPPVASVRRTDEQARQQVIRAVDEAMQRADESVAAQLQKLRDAAEQAGPSGETPTAGEASEVVLPANIDNDQVTQLLRQGDFQAALESVEQALRTSGGLSKGFYQKGMAQLALAEQAGDKKLYKSAGLNFMRSVIYFPRSRYVGPALTEAGYVHAKIGRQDLARKLYDRARIQIDEEEDALYHQRLMALFQRLDENGEPDRQSE